MEKRKDAEPSTRRAEARRPPKERPRTRCSGDKTDPQKIPAWYPEGGFSGALSGVYGLQPYEWTVQRCGRFRGDPFYGIQDTRIITNKWRRKACRPGTNYIRIFHQWDISPLDRGTEATMFHKTSVPNFRCLSAISQIETNSVKTLGFTVITI